MTPAEHIDFHERASLDAERCLLCLDAWIAQRERGWRLVDDGVNTPARVERTGDL